MSDEFSKELNLAPSPFAEFCIAPQTIRVTREVYRNNAAYTSLVVERYAPFTYRFHAYDRNSGEYILERINP